MTQPDSETSLALPSYGMSDSGSTSLRQDSAGASVSTQRPGAPERVCLRQMYQGASSVSSGISCQVSGVCCNHCPCRRALLSLGLRRAGCTLALSLGSRRPGALMSVKWGKHHLPSPARRATLATSTCT